MRILVVNPNTTAAMTESIGETARRCASPGTEIVPLTARYGASGIDSNFESLISAVAVMDLVSGYRDTFDAVVLAGFGEHGREGVQEIIGAPVFDIAECSAHVAQLIGRSYSVVTTLRRSIAAIEDRLTVAGLFARCASVRAVGLSTLDIERHPDDAARQVFEQARLAVHEDRAEVLCLGCAGMTGLDELIAADLGVPVVDGVAAAVRLAEAVVGMGLRTSKVNTYAYPEGNALTGWPPSAFPGLAAPD